VIGPPPGWQYTPGMPPASASPVLPYGGDCGLCAGSVQFLLPSGEERARFLG